MRLVVDQTYLSTNHLIIIFNVNPGLSKHSLLSLCFILQFINSSLYILIITLTLYHLSITRAAWTYLVILAVESQNNEHLLGNI